MTLAASIPCNASSDRTPARLLEWNLVSLIASWRA